MKGVSCLACRGVVAVVLAFSCHLTSSKFKHFRTNNKIKVIKTHKEALFKSPTPASTEVSFSGKVEVRGGDDVIAGFLLDKLQAD